MKYKDITIKSKADAVKELGELRTQLMELRLKLKLSQGEKNHKVSQLRKDIARLLTHLNNWIIEWFND